MITRRHPRTLQEAFGPYTSRDLHVPIEPDRQARYIFMAICVAAILGFVLVVVCN